MQQSAPMLLVRLLTGVVFLLEGALKFALPAELGAGRFVAIGLPFANYLAPAIGFAEVVGGACLLLGLYAGDAALGLLFVMAGALVTTKLPILAGQSVGPFACPKLAHYGLLSFLHESRTDLAMVFCLTAVLIDRGVRLGRRTPWYQSRNL